MKKLLTLFILFSNLNISAQPQKVAELPDEAENAIAAAGHMFFNIGGELWRSDGTDEGTFSLEETGLMYKRQPVDNGLFFFSETDDGEVLWFSDGSPENTYPVATFDSVSIFVRTIAGVGQNIFFAADDGTSGMALWRSEGTAEGTMMVEGLEVQDEASLRQFTVNGDDLYFVADGGAGRQLWKCDLSGTEAIQVSEFEEEEVHVIAALEHDLIFLTRGNYDPTEGVFDIKFYKTGGDFEGIEYITTLRGVNISLAGVLDSKGIFWLRKHSATHEIWVTDGTEEGTQLLDSYRAIDSFLSNFTEVDGKLAFMRNIQRNSSSLFITDGTPEGTDSWLLNSNRAYENQMAAIDETLYYSDNKVLWTEGTSEDVFHLWQSDLTEEGSQLMEDVYNTDEAFERTSNLVAINNILYFTTSPLNEETTLWMYNPEGTEEPDVTSLFVANKEEILVYPNPFKDNLTINLLEDGHIIFFDMYGNEVKEILANVGRNTLKLIDMAPGVYLLKIKNKEIKPIRIVKQ